MNEKFLKNKNILLDLDDTLVDLYPLIQNLEHINPILNNHQGKEFFNIMIKEKMIENVKPFKTSKLFLQYLKKLDFNITIMTARNWHPNAKEITEKYLLHHELIYDNLIISDFGKSKINFIPENEYFLFSVDDNPKCCHDFYVSDKILYPFCLKGPTFDYFDYPSNPMNSLCEIENAMNFLIQRIWA